MTFVTSSWKIGSKFYSSWKRLCVPAIADSGHNAKILINYFIEGRVDEAQKLFDEITVKNVVLWTIMVQGYARNGLNRVSVECFSRMHASGMFLNSFTIVAVLVSIACLRNLDLVRSIHGFTAKSGLESDSFVGTALLDSYARCGTIADSHRLFVGLKERNLVSYNAFLTGLVNNRLFIEAVWLFKHLLQSGLIPNAVTALSLIQGCIASESRGLCESIHGLVAKLGLGLDISINNSILNMYSSFMDLHACAKTFGEMKTKDVISFTTLTGLLVQLERACDAVNLFCRMRVNGIMYDKLAIINLCSACASLGHLRIARQTHAQAIISGFASKLCLANTIISMYAKCGDLRSSRILFDRISERNLASWTAMISGCAQNGFKRDALDLLIRFRVEENCCPDALLVIGALTVAGELASLELCQQLHCYSSVAGFPSYRSMQNSLITAYSKCGMAELAFNIFKEMGSLKDTVSWNAIISGYGFNGRGRTAVSLFHEMRMSGEDPDSATYSCVLSACSHSELAGDGLMIFKQMVEENRIRPSQEHFGCVIDLLARAGCLSNMKELDSSFWYMLGPDVWRALLSGCLLHGNVGLAEVAARRLFEMDPGETGQVALMSNVYALAGRFQDAESLRLSMEKKGLVKDPGLSMIGGLS